MLLIVAAAMVMLLGVSALSIDLVSFYVARSEAQRAADAAALAGAEAFVAQGCASGLGGCVSGGAQESVASAQAAAVAAQNLVGGQAPSSASVASTFTYPNAAEPQITVTVYRDGSHGNPMPTFFAKIFGVSTVNVSAAATAEAYGSSGGSLSVGVGCVKPFLVPNCDPAHPVKSGDREANTNCGKVSAPAGQKGTYYASYLVDPNDHYSVVNPGVYNASNPSAGGIVGEPWQLHSNAAPSQWYLVGYTGNSASALRQYIETCAPIVITCGSQVNTANGKKVGPTTQGIEALINANADGLNQGQDTICSPTTTPACTSSPFPITGGSNNPNPNLVGRVYYGPSPSVANVIVYDGHTLKSGGDTVTVVGFMNVFVQDAVHSGSADLIDTVILGIAGCGSTCGSSTPITAQGTAIPVRLIHP